MNRPEQPSSSPLPPFEAAGCELLGEREMPGAWEYDAQLLGQHGELRRLVLVLSWADYQMWVPDGGLAPSRVADALLRFIAAHLASFAGQERIDASTLRRRVPGADKAIAQMLGDGV